MNNYLSCPICKSNKITLTSSVIAECNNCGLKFIRDIQSSDFYRKIYDKNYFAGDVYKDYLKEESYRRSIFKSKIKLIRKHIPPKGIVLDIGCGMGFFLMEMEKEGYKIKGFEISEYASSIASRKLNTHVFSSDFLNTDCLHTQFDIVTLWDLLEHLPDPESYLKKISQIIKSNGVLIIETLNTSSLTAKLLKEKWPLYSPPYHIFYFTDKTISLLLKQAGFKLIKRYPVQTYVKTFTGYRTLRYFKYPLVRKLIGIFFNDVVIYIAKPS